MRQVLKKDLVYPVEQDEEIHLIQDYTLCVNTYSRRVVSGTLIRYFRCHVLQSLHFILKSGYL